MGTSGGSFVKALQVAAVSTGNTFLVSVYNNVTIAVPVVEIGEITAVSNSNPPTPAPSLPPTTSAGGTGGGSLLVGVGIAAGIAVLGLGSLVAMKIRRDKNDSKKNYLVAVEG